MPSPSCLTTCHLSQRERRERISLALLFRRLLQKTEKFAKEKAPVYGGSFFFYGIDPVAALIFEMPDKLFLRFDDILLILEAFISYILCQNYQTDEVRDSHETIGGIGEVPDEGESHGGADVGYEGE